MGNKERSVCIISDDFYPPRTGVGVILLPVARAFSRLGANVVVITTRAPGQRDREVVDGIQVYRLPSVKLFGFLQAIPNRRTILSILQSHQVEVVYHNYLSHLAWVAASVSRSLELRQVFTFHMTVDLLTQPLVLRPLRPLFQYLIDRFCSRMDLITVPTSFLAEEIKGRYSVPIKLIGNPLPSLQGQSARPFTVLYAGRLDEEKNVKLLIGAFALLLAARPKCELWIAGAGRTRTYLEKQAKKLRVSGAVRFLGWVDRGLLADFYAQASVFVLPSRFETQGLVAVEAMSFSLPVIMCRQVGSSAELVYEGQNGFLVDADNPKELAERLVQLHDDPALCARLGEMGRNFASNPDLSVENISAQYLEALDLSSSALDETRISKTGPR